ncbi:MAG: MerR family DNA-binding transcriptional regulator [Roseinatronobacter sp.]|nr:MerR family DNA-binding transcriptional regulator [Roseinatronobacter sp.]
MPEDVKTIRQMCAEYGVTPRTLRFYEASGRRFPQRDGQHRLFSRREEARLKLILRGKRFGFTLDEIGELLNMYDRDDSELRQLRRTCEIAYAHLAEMERKRDELEEAIEDLKQELAWGETILRTASPPKAQE